ncbi:MAG: small, acid-soluble spore protein, alpha/beta type [bacterium]|nr:small, acid-soluble spore protein, alpha/beta type [bacterium]
MPKKKKDSFDVKNMKPEDLLKFEIAKELGLEDKVMAGGWRCLTAKESGRIGGLITKRKREMKKEAQREQEEQEQMLLS